MIYYHFIRFCQITHCALFASYHYKYQKTTSKSTTSITTTEAPEISTKTKTTEKLTTIEEKVSRETPSALSSTLPSDLTYCLELCPPPPFSEFSTRKIVKLKIQKSKAFFIEKDLCRQTTDPTKFDVRHSKTLQWDGVVQI